MYSLTHNRSSENNVSVPLLVKNIIYLKKTASGLYFKVIFYIYFVNKPISKITSRVTALRQFIYI